MRDGRTRKLASRGSDTCFSEYLAGQQISIVIVEGGETGQEFALEQERTTLGRGPGVDLAFADSAMSREHAAIEFTSEGFRIRDLGSMNGVLVNGASLRVGDLKHGDHFQLGAHVFRLLIEERMREPRTYVLPEA